MKTTIISTTLSTLLITLLIVLLYQAGNKNLLVETSLVPVDPTREVSVTCAKMEVALLKASMTKMHYLDYCEMIMQTAVYCQTAGKRVALEYVDHMFERSCYKE